MGLENLEIATHNPSFLRKITDGLRAIEGIVRQLEAG